ncbi:MAG: DUF5680 domain-containing protein [Clostridium sp.]
MADKDLFKQFLIEAKQNGRQAESCRPNSKDNTFKKYEYYYYSSLIGNDNFIGQDVVWKSEKPFWAMNYSSKNLTANIPSGFSYFLRNALSNATTDNPFRGPNYFEENDFVYECTYTGDIASFIGEEIVRYNGEIIYKLSFHGGELN